MKKFTSKNIFEKFIFAIVCVILLNFCIAPNVQAEGGTSFGGKMMSIMRDFTTAVADVAASVVQLGMTGEWSYAVADRGNVTTSGHDYWIKESEFRYPMLQISPEVIFANKVQLLDANFISSQTTDSSKYLIEAKNTAPISTLRRIVASWHVTLRTIAVVGLLSVLIYIGIRIIISSTAQDKAKYKQRLVDWVIAFCLLFFMHYIMAAVVTVVDRVNAMLSDDVIKGISLNPKYGNIEYNDQSGDHNFDFGGTGTPSQNPNSLGEFTKENVLDADVGKWDDEVIREVKSVVGTECTDEGTWSEPTVGTTSATGAQLLYTRTMTFEGATVTITKADTVYMDMTARENRHRLKYSYSVHKDNPTVNPGSEGESGNASLNLKVDSKGRYYVDGDKILYFTNYARLYLNVKDKDEYLQMSTAYLIIYIALITFTVVFTIRYIKRVIYIAFLTLMAPMVALTYPLDKIRDRKSPSMGYVV
ncbi:MAG: hypothetical protein HFJ52_06085 [Clostridia bacterium]|nr:hypothetical protein [Clostridia bacterium]